MERTGTELNPNLLLIFQVRKLIAEPKPSLILCGSVEQQVGQDLWIPHKGYALASSYKN